METNKALLEVIKKLEEGKLVFSQHFFIKEPNIVNYQLVNTETGEEVFIWSVEEAEKEDSFFGYRKELNKEFKEKHERNN